MVLFWIIYYIAYWKLFIKMKYSGWKCLLPIYNEYLLCKKVNVNKIFTIIYLIVKSIVLFLGIIYFIFIIIFLIVGPFIQLLVLDGFFENINWNSFFVGIILFSIFFLIYKIMRGYVIYKTSLIFDKSKGNSIALGIFNFIGVMILGFDNSV